MAASEWTTTEHALGYLSRADALPHRTEGEAVLLDHVPSTARRILDLGTGDGRLLALLRIDRPDSEGVGLDVSEPMLAAARERFSGCGGRLASFRWLSSVAANALTPHQRVGSARLFPTVLGLGRSAMTADPGPFFRRSP